jgi:hypothetical protein
VVYGTTDENRQNGLLSDPSSFPVYSFAKARSVLSGYLISLLIVRHDMMAIISAGLEAITGGG